MRLLVDAIESVAHHSSSSNISWCCFGGRCVNHVSFNALGTQLLSGSDDTRVCIWDVAAKPRLKHVYRTGHRANIFCTRFMPGSNDNLIASCAGDHEIRVRNLECGHSLVLGGHASRVKKLCMEPNNPNLILSGSEDATVRMWDLREVKGSVEVNRDENNDGDEISNAIVPVHSTIEAGDENVVFRVQSQGYNVEINSISLNQQRPWLLAVGADDQYLRIVDRRKSNAPVKYFCVPNMDDSSLGGSGSDGTSFSASSMLGFTLNSSHITGVAFSPCGREVLASYHDGPVQLFDIDNADSLDAPLKVDLCSRSRFLANSTCASSIVTASSAIKLVTTFIANGVLLVNEARGQLSSLHYKRSRLQLNAAQEARAEHDPSAGELAAAALDDARLSRSLRPSSARAWLLEARILHFSGRLKDAHESLATAEGLGWNQELQDFKDMLEKDITTGKSNVEDNSTLPVSGPEGKTSKRKSRQDGSDSHDASKWHAQKQKGKRVEEDDWPSCSKRYTRSFTGHQNLRTVKDVAFLGPNGECVASGSDDGHWLLWEKRTGRVLARLEGDEHVVNCVQSSPTAPLVASCGIDSTVKLWSPRSENIRQRSTRGCDSYGCRHDDESLMDRDSVLLQELVQAQAMGEIPCTNEE
mgnify:CR=1 FL=1